MRKHNLSLIYLLSQTCFMFQFWKFHYFTHHLTMLGKSDHQCLYFYKFGCIFNISMVCMSAYPVKLVRILLLQNSTQHDEVMTSPYSYNFNLGEVLLLPQDRDCIGPSLEKPTISMVNWGCFKPGCLLMAYTVLARVGPTVFCSHDSWLVSGLDSCLYKWSRNSWVISVMSNPDVVYIYVCVGGWQCEYVCTCLSMFAFPFGYKGKLCIL